MIVSTNNEKKVSYLYLKTYLIVASHGERLSRKN